MQKNRKCGSRGLNNFNRPKFKIHGDTNIYNFCPGKATWYEKSVEIFSSCLFAYQTGIMPKDAPFQDQEDIFVLVFPHFVEVYTQRQYQRTWRDVQDFAGEVFKAIGKMFGGK